MANQRLFENEIKRLNPKSRVDIIRRDLKTNPLHKWLTEQLAFALTANGEHKATIEIWTGFFKKQPGLVVVQSGLTSALKPLPARSRIRVLGPLLQDVPNSLYLQERLGLAYAAAKEFSQAIPLHQTK